MYMKDEKIVEIDDYRLELENRIRNLLWTISGDYTLNMKVDVSLYLRSKAIALYDGIKQGALAKYYDRNLCVRDPLSSGSASHSSCSGQDTGEEIAAASSGDAGGCLCGHFFRGKA